MARTEVIEVSVTRNSGSLTLGIISIVLAVLCLLICWIPFLGLIAIPGAVIALLLALLGILLALLKAGRGIAMPLIGLFLSLAPIGISVVFTGATSTAMSTAIQESSARQSAANAAAIASLVVEDAAWRVDSSLGSSNLVVSYKLRNVGDETISTAKVAIKFYDGAGGEIAQREEFAISLFDEDLRPGNVVEQKENLLSYTDIPADLVDSVEVDVIEATAR